MRARLRRSGFTPIAGRLPAALDHFIMKPLFRSLSLAACITLAACTVGPDYHRETIRLPDRFAEHQGLADQAQLAASARELRQWWAYYRDPLLNRLVTQAIDNNNDFKIAGQRILAERALRDIQASAWYPQLDGSVGGGDVRHSIVVNDWPLRPGTAGNDPEVPYLMYGATASWETDLFGKVRRSVEASDAAVQVSVEQRRGVLLAMLQALVSDYVALRANQQALAVAQQSAKVANEAMQLAQHHFRDGIGTSLEIDEAKAELKVRQSDFAPLQRNIAQITHAIDVLLGQLPGTTEAELKQPGPMPEVPDYPETLPARVLLNRPDIRAAERSYAEATARIGVAVAQLYPDLSVPLTYNPIASSLSQLFTINAQAWQFLLKMSLPLAHGGRDTARIIAAKASAEASRLQYHQTVLQAFRDIEDAMVAWQKDSQYARARRDVVAADEQVYARARRMYAGGLVDFLQVLTSERSLLSDRQSVVLAQEAWLQDSVRLFTALGGGWRGVSVTRADVPVSIETQHVMARALLR